ncbi:putative membrane protein [Plasticicumulans lactativorans]|uniref:Putative membrane protein n=1 Tax=Plasticicumulans lactativorans TaxID=1133106 RepID=A0A4R2KWE3_9GAMM|nr:putative membrane protein [Plasticicumulans lactativorans]
MELNDLALARALHVLGVVLWIGGVAFVTAVLLPAVRRLDAPVEPVAFFERIEGRFAAQARWTTALVGASGLWLTWRLDAGWRFAEPRFWWMHAMVAVWALFTLMLFVLEPLLLHRWFHARAVRDPSGTLALILRLHRVLLALSLLTVFGAVLGAHGGAWLAR